MNSGKVFEKDWKDSIDETKIYYLRLKDSPSSFGQDSSFVRFTSNNPYDSFCFYEGGFFPMELKHTKNSSFSFQRNKSDKGKMIKLSQIEGLKKASLFSRCFAGFIFNIYNEKNNTNNTYWLDIANFEKFFNETDKHSINEKDIKNYGGIFVQNAQKKIHYKYDVESLLCQLLYGGR